MSEKEHYTTEDIDDLNTVLQLAPHEKNTQYTTVTKTESGDLISLDEVYERTGQESINKAIEGFKMLLENKKLKREHGVLLNVTGAENWLELPDRMNAIRGGENFLSSIGNAFVKIIKAIIEYIKKACTWVYVRIRSMFGFAKTKEEVLFLQKKTEMMKEEVVKLFELMGIPGYDPKELIKELPEGKTPTEQLKIIGNKLNNSAPMMKRLVESQTLVAELHDGIGEMMVNMSKTKDKYDVLMAGLKSLVNKPNLSINDYDKFTIELIELGKQYFNVNHLKTTYTKLTSEVYGIEPNNLGVNKSLSELKDKIQSISGLMTVKFDSDVFVDTDEVIYEINNRVKFNTRKPFGPKSINYLKSFLNDSDMAIIDSIAELTKDNKIKFIYSEFCMILRDFTTFADMSMKIIQEVEASYTTIIKANSKMKMYIASLTTKNIELILKDPKTLTDDERRILEFREESLFNIKSLNEKFYELYPDGHITKKVSDSLNIFLKTGIGKEFLRTTKNFVHRYTTQYG